MNFDLVKETAEQYKADMTKFLRDLVRIPGESGKEKEKIERAAAEMQNLGFDTVEIDPMGNLLGYMGTGDTLIAYDGHIDTVGIGNAENWDFDPYEGFEDEEQVGGRGTADQEGGIVSAVYGAKIMKELGLLNAQCRVLVTATVQEEDCDGLCWQYIINEDKVKPEFVVITEPTNGNICRGQRGRMEIKVDVGGISCHGSAPERGENAIYKMAKIIAEIEQLNDHLQEDPFLGKGTLAVSEIFSTSPSRCAVADSCSISIDRRLTSGETYRSALEELRVLPAIREYDASVSMYTYQRPSFTGLVYPTDCFFPAWVTAENHRLTLAMAEAHQRLYGQAKVDKWTFSTNGVSIMGRYGIPCIGFGPGREEEAHAPNEKIMKNDLVKCSAVYAVLPSIYLK